MTIQKPYMKPGAEPVFRQGGGRVGCLCLHGFAAAPAETRWLSEYLSKEGYTTYAPRLSGHGVNSRAMARRRWEDWFVSAYDGFELLAQQCDEVAVIGISMGGLLALALDVAAPVAATVAIAAPVVFYTKLPRYMHYIKYLIPFANMADVTELPQILREEQNRRGEPIVGRVHYDMWSTAAVAQLYDLSQTVQNNLHGVTAPLQLIYSEKDPAVPLESQQIIARGVGSTVVEQHTLTMSGHVITLDVEREKAFALVADFLARHTRKD